MIFEVTTASNKRPPFRVRRRQDRWFVDVKSMSELMSPVQQAGCPLIIDDEPIGVTGSGHIMVYDDYIE